jgi:SRSO17 transposase
VEPMAARLDPLHVSAKHQSMHHFVAKAGWSDTGLLARVAQWVGPHMDVSQGSYWIVDDTGFPKKGEHSVGVARQYCGVLGKQDNCQVAVSVSLSCQSGSLPVAWQLYLPKAWAEDPARRAKAGVPEELGFATKPQIALQQIKALLNAQPKGVEGVEALEGATPRCVLADAGYGVDSAFRRGLSELGLPYVVGVTSVLSVWPPGVVPAAALPYSGRGRPPSRPRRSAKLQPMSVKALAHTLPSSAFQTIEWREGSNALLSGRFAALRVRCAGGSRGRARLLPEQWLLIEWPENQAEPEKYCLSTLPATCTLSELVNAAHQRWRIERDYQDLKQDLGLGHYEGRGWRGFHHHASLAIAAYGFLMAQRLQEGGDSDGKKNFIVSQLPALPKHQRPRGVSTSTASRARLNHHTTLATRN